MHEIQSKFERCANHNSYFMTKLGLLDKPNDLDF